MAQTNWLHIQDGVFIRRTDVDLVELGQGPDFNSVAPLTALDAASWASALAHVCARGETAITHAEARAFHEVGH